MIPVMERLGKFTVQPIVWVLFAFLLMLVLVLLLIYSRLAKRHDALLGQVDDLDHDLTELEKTQKKLGRGHSSVASRIRQMERAAAERPLARPAVPATAPLVQQPQEGVEPITGRHGAPPRPPVPSRLRRDSA
jgi:hypothetical protein